MRHLARLLLLGLGLTLAAPAGVNAQQTVVPPATVDADTETSDGDDPRTWINYLDAVELELDQTETLDRARANAISAEVLRIQEQARTLESSIAQRMQPLRREINSLGPPPAEDQPPEAAEDALLRQNLQNRISELESRSRLSRLTIARSDNIQNLLIEHETTRLRQQLLIRTPSLFRSETWLIAGKTTSELVAKIVQSPIVWWRQFDKDHVGRLLAIFAAIVIFAGVAYSIRRRLLARIDRHRQSPDPAYSAKVIVALQSAAADIVLPAACFGIVVIAIRALSESNTLFMAAIDLGCLLAIAYFTASGLARSIFQPAFPQWRLIVVDDDSAEKITRGVRLLAFVAMGAFWFVLLAETAGVVTPEFGSAVTFVSDLAIVLLAARILPHRFIPDDSDEPHAWARISSAIIALALIAVPLLDIAAYSRLASYVLLYLIISVIALGLAFLVRVAATQAVDWAVRPERRAVRMVGPAARKGDLEFLRFVLMLTVDILIYVPVVWLLLVFYGIPTAQLIIWLNYFINGFTIGSVTIAPFDLILGVIVFAAVLLVTNLVRRAAARQLTDRMRVDVGVRNAVLSAINYVGIVVAVILAIATIGLDLSNLALVASALSVGIGFGLRTVVENFVAGLLLLIERPIKEGDWIVTGGRDGTVKKISVRSTEVETFDRSTIIVPNSELIAQPVENWSHRNRMSRVIIPVGVAYGSNTEQVREILLECIGKDPNIMSYPQPQVLFLAFGESSLDFQVRYFLADTDYRMTSISNMHYAIDAAFREAGIEIPFPQRDVHVRSDGQTGAGNAEDSEAADTG